MAEFANGNDMLFISEDHDQEGEDDLGDCHVCSKPAKGACGVCGDIAYCSEDCQLEDWDEHCDECVVTYVTDPKSTLWTSEAEVGQEYGGKSAEEKYIGLPLVHVFLQRNGLVKGQINNEDLIEGLVARWGRKSVARSGKQRLPAGRRKKGPAEIYIYIPDPDDMTRAIANARILISQPTRNHWKFGRSGTNIYATGRDLQRAVSDENLYPVPTSGKIAIGADVDGNKHMVWGNYNLAGSATRTFRQRLFGMFRRRVFRLPKKVRIKAIDTHGVGAVVGLERPATADSRARMSPHDVRYIVKYIEVFIPDGIPGTLGKDASDGWWDPFDNKLDAETARFASGAPPPPEHDEGELLVRTLRAAGMEAAIRQEEQHEPDPDCLEDMVALASLLGYEIDGLRLEHELARDDNDPDDAADIQEELDEATRLRSVIDKHIDDLHDHEEGIINYPEIPSHVNSAVTDAYEMVNSKLSEWMKKRKEKRIERLQRKETELMDLIQSIQDGGGIAGKEIRRLNRVIKQLKRLNKAPQDMPRVRRFRDKRRELAREKRSQRKQTRRETRKGFKAARKGRAGGDVEEYGRKHRYGGGNVYGYGY